MSLKLIFSQGNAAKKSFYKCFFPFPNLLSDHFDEDILTMQYSFFVSLSVSLSNNSDCCLLYCDGNVHQECFIVLTVIGHFFPSFALIETFGQYQQTWNGESRVQQ